MVKFLLSWQSASALLIIGRIVLRYRALDSHPIDCRSQRGDVIAKRAGTVRSDLDRT